MHGIFFNHCGKYNKYKLQNFLCITNMKKGEKMITQFSNSKFTDDTIKIKNKGVRKISIQNTPEIM